MTRGYLAHTLDTSMGERISVERHGNQTEAELTLMLDPDGFGFSVITSTLLGRLELRALAALCLIAADEIERS